MNEYSAFGMDSYFAEQDRRHNKMEASRLDSRTKYELMYYDFIREDYITHSAEHIIRSNEMRSLINETLMDYCLLVTTNRYVITAIKTKPAILPDNNNLIPATYRCAILNKNCKVIEKFGQIASKKVYDLFVLGKYR